MLKLLWVLQGIFIVSLSCKLLGGEGSVALNKDLNRQLADLQEANLRDHVRNETLAAQIKSLKYGDEAIEEYARSRYGMIKPDETLYRLDEFPLPH